jgi:hypothetical protein
MALCKDLVVLQCLWSSKIAAHPGLMVLQAFSIIDCSHYWYVHMLKNWCILYSATTIHVSPDKRSCKPNNGGWCFQGPFQSIMIKHPSKMVMKNNSYWTVILYHPLRIIYVNRHIYTYKYIYRIQHSSWRNQYSSWIIKYSFQDPIWIRHKPLVK